MQHKFRAFVKRYAIALLLILSTILSAKSEIVNYDGLSYEVNIWGSAALTYNRYNNTSDGHNRYNDETIVIPSYINNNGRYIPVNTIGQRAFANSKNLTTIVIPDAITWIQEDAFFSCDNLKSIHLPKNLEMIESNAFRKCTSLSDIQIPINTYYIGDCAFADCSALTNFKFPDSLQEIRTGVLAWCTNLNSVEIPASVKKIGYRAFSGCGITSLDISNVEYIAENAFENSKLISVKMSSEIDKIENGVFQNCQNLRSVQFPTYLSEIGDFVFAGCKQLETIRIPYNVQKIGKYSFSGCESLTYIDVAHSESISVGLFSGCKNLTSVIMGNATEICELAFENCSALSSIDLRHISKIGRSSFKNCTSLTSIEIYRNVTSIGISAFEGCSNLVSLIYKPWDCTCEGSLDNPVFPPSISSLTIDTTNIPSYFLAGGNQIEELDIPYKVESIGDYAFKGSSKLKELTIPNNVLSIGTGAFKCSDILEEVTIIGEDCYPYDRFYYSDEVFGNCKSLHKIIFNSNNAYISGSWISNSPVEVIIFGKNVKEIPSNICKDCSTLRSVSIPSSVQKIGSKAFYGCYGLLDVRIEDLNAWCNVSFANPESNPIYYSRTFRTYDSDVPVEHIDLDVWMVKDYAFYNAQNIKTARIRAEQISSDAFSNCENLRILSINTQQINEDTFNNCSIQIIYSLSDTPPRILGRNYTIYGIATESVLCVPLGAKKNYVEDEFWMTNFYCCNESSFGNEDLIFDPTVEKDPNYIPVEAILIKGSSGIEVEKGCPFQLEYKILPENASNQHVIWTSSDTDVAQIDNQGIINARNYGNCVVYATCQDSKNTIIANCPIKIEYPTKNMKLTWDQKFECYSGDKVLLTAESSDPNFPAYYRCIKPDGGFKRADIFEEDGNWYASFDNPGMVILEAFTEITQEITVRKTFNVLPVELKDDELIYVDGLYYRYVDDNRNSLKVVRGFEVYRGDYEIPHEVLGIPVKEIDSQAFYSCKELRNVIISEGVESISYEAFGNCSLSSIDIPASLQNWGSYIFNANRDSMKDIYIHAVTPPILYIVNDESIFNATSAFENCNLHVPQGTIDAYRNAKVWQNFVHIYDDLGSISAISSINVDNQLYTVYGIDGALLIDRGSKETLGKLMPGLYIVNGKKKLIGQPHSIM